MPKHRELNLTRKYQIQSQVPYGIKAPHSKEFTADHVPAPFDEDAYYERTDHRYSPAFKDYQKKVVALIRRITTDVMCRCEPINRRWDGYNICLTCDDSYPPSTRDIHLALAIEDAAEPRWTLDAIEMSGNILTLWGIPDRFLWFDGQKTIEKVQWNGYHVSTAKKAVSADLGLEPRVLA